MILLVYTSSSAELVSQRLGQPEYSYRFVVREFQPLLDELGIVVEVTDPVREVDAIYANCRRHETPCLFLCFMPPNKAPLGLDCPTIPVFAWEYETLPNEAFGGKPRNDWTRVLAKIGAAMTHSSFTVECSKAALGPDFPIISVPAPLWDRMQSLPSSAGSPITLPIEGMVIDSRRTDLSAYRKSQINAALPDSLPLPENRHLYQGDVTLDGVLYTAIFNPHDGRKNWQEMISGFCVALRHKRDATLVLKLTHQEVDALVPEILELIYKAGPIDCRVVLLHAYLKEPEYNALLQASSFAVNTSHGEGQCLPLMEYMSAGKPALAPRHTSMRDYIDANCAFVIDSSDEPGTWPHDQRQSFRTLRQRIHFHSLVDAYRKSYHVARHEPHVYAAMGAAARASLERYCSMAVVRPRLRDFVRQRLGTAEHSSDDQYPIEHG